MPGNVNFSDMTTTVEAIYENGMLKLRRPLPLEELRIPTNSDTHSNPIRTAFRDIRTDVGAKRRSACMIRKVSELSQVFLYGQGLFFGA